jgi:hypothetical protein
MNHNVLQVLGAALKHVLTTQSSYVNGPEVSWDDVAAQVILQCDGKLTIMSQDVFAAITGDIEACGPGMGKEADEPIPFELTELGKLATRKTPETVGKVLEGVIRSYAHNVVE